MPIYKFRSLQESEDTLFQNPDDPELLSRIRSLWQFSARLFPRKFPPGVYKYRSIEEANKQKDAWNIQAIKNANKIDN
jgi:hypothetical protein